MKVVREYMICDKCGIERLGGTASMHEYIFKKDEKENIKIDLCQQCAAKVFWLFLQEFSYPHNFEDITEFIQTHRDVK